MPKSTRKPAARKARILQKARQLKKAEQIPLIAHSTLRWARKIRGRTCYFGPIDPHAEDLGAGAAMAEYHRTADDLRAGRRPRPKDDDLATLADAANAFLTAKESKLQTGEITARSFSEYHATCSRMIDMLGKHRAVVDLDSADFRKLRAAFAERRGPVALGNDIRRARMVFKFAWDEGLIDRPVRFGQAFDPPSRKTLRQNRAARGPRMFEAGEIRRIIDAADQPVKAWILLGINCGFGQTDLARLPKSAIDLDGGWINFARPKTGIERRVPIWLETAEALRDWLPRRPEPADPADDELVFLTRRGRAIVREQASRKHPARTATVDNVGHRLGKLKVQLGINGNRAFYALRHTFETVAGDSRDQVAVDAIMGHVDSSMAGLYRERISDDRLRAVVEHVRKWLYPRPKNR